VKLKDNVAVVTGGSRGIGRAVCLQLAAEGAAVAVNYRNREREAQDVVTQIEAGGGTAVALQGDVSDPVHASELIEETVARLGGVHILVNNAGVSRDGLIVNMEPEDWRAVMEVNFGGTFNCTRAVAPHLMRQRAGAIVNVSSLMGERGWIGQANYAASKAAVNSLTRCSAGELARFGVRVNAVLAGFTDTDLVAPLLARSRANIARQIPMRTVASVDQIARAVVFLAGPDSGYMTGALVPVDGGGSAQLGLGRAG
jgi:3-oxoacyl-[acyl-carrier protein] reductase